MNKDNIFYFILIFTIVGLGIFYFNSQNQPVPTNSSTSASAKASKNTIEIKNYSFSPQEITVKKGTTVTWENFDLVPHTVTMDDKTKEGPKSDLFGKGKKYSYTFSKPGTYTYHCEPHPYMKGIVKVTE